MERRILLNEKRTKRSTNENMTAGLSLMNNANPLPSMQVMEDVSGLDVYNAERLACKNARLTVSVNVIASNVLFNHKTEVVQFNGTKDAVLVNSVKKVDHLKDDDGEVFNNLTRDTKLSFAQSFDDPGCACKYYPGTDIFNNHLIRSKTFKLASPKNNHIKSWLYSGEGDSCKGYHYKKDGSRETIQLHTYRKTDILPFDEAVPASLVERDGWFGFNNHSVIGIGEGDGKCFDRVLGNEMKCSHISMYPSRDLFPFNVEYNKHWKRDELNWDYLLLYPSKSVYKGFGFIDERHQSLVITSFDDRIVGAGGKKSIRIYSVCKHGLSVGDKIVVFSGEDILEEPLDVTAVVDEYTFDVDKGKKSFPSEWVDFGNSEGMDVDDKYFVVKPTYVYDYENPSVRYKRHGTSANINPASKCLSFAKYVNGEASIYYVRVFSKMPNFKWYTDGSEITDIYRAGSHVIEDCQKSEYDFETHAGTLGFAKNIYGDEIGEIVYTDDIEYGKVKNNLGLPVTSLYMSFKKRNAGYREWYGKEGKEPQWGSEKVERSRAFGKVNCAFELSEASEIDGVYKDARKLHNIKTADPYDQLCNSGLSMKELNPDRPDELDDDEIIYRPIRGDNGELVYDGDKNFYGDICSFDWYGYQETVIQEVCYRFAPAQRELNEEDSVFNVFKEFSYDEIKTDDNDDEFEVETFSIPSNSTGTPVCQRKEGYIYEPHSEIRIRTLASEPTIDNGKRFYIKRIHIDGNGLSELWTYDTNFMENGTEAYIYDTQNKTAVKIKAVEILTLRKFRFEFDENDSSFTVDQSRLNTYLLVKPDIEALPSNAILMRDGTARLMWRDVIQNGFDVFDDIEVYPFTNNALYISHNAGIYIRRQGPWPDEIVNPIDIDPDYDKEERDDKYHKHTDIIC